MNIHFRRFVSFGYLKLNEKEKKIYDIVSQEWLNYQAGVSVSCSDSGADLQKVINAIFCDIPELFYIDSSSVRIVVRSREIIFRARFLYSKVLCESYKASIKSVVSSLDCEGKSDIEKEYIAYKYLTDHITYSDTPGTGSYTVKGVFIDGEAVCEGFAKAFKLLCDELNIASLLVHGFSLNGNVRERHAWNIVNVNSHSYHVDVTWGKTTQDEIGVYFNGSDLLFSAEHEWDRALYPSCIEKGWFERKIRHITDIAQLDDVLLRLTRKECCRFCLRIQKSFADSSEAAQFIGERLNKLFPYHRPGFKIKYYKNLDVIVVSVA